MDLSNLFEVVVHHLLVGGITSIYWDEVPMVSAPVCMVTHRIGPKSSGGRSGVYEIIFDYYDI